MHAYADHPRPDFARPRRLSLDGEWEFEFDPTNVLDGDARMLEKTLKRKIRVPFVYQSRLSGIGDTGLYPTVWYRKVFGLPAGWGRNGGRVLLRFGAVDYRCVVRLNGQVVGSHEGGYAPFSFDITRYVAEKENVLLVKADDDPDISQPRGKQSWGASFACWYTQMTGIWQSVWLEAVPETWLKNFHLEPSIDGANGTLAITALPSRPERGASLRLELGRNGAKLLSKEVPLEFPSTRTALTLTGIEPWSPENPALYDLKMTVSGAAGDDVVESYCAFRTVGLTEDSFLLNGSPRFLRLVLDQGYWPESLYTPPSDEAMIRDITAAKAMGFDGCRKHMKLEDPRFLYHADRLGFFVWSELPAPYAFNDASRLAVLGDLHGMIERDANHPSLITWVIYNESWGVREADESLAIRAWLSFLVSLARSMDPARPVVDNDGWHHADTDLLTYHSYAQDGPTLRTHHASYLDGGVPAGRPLMAGKTETPVRPLMASEFGGIGYRMKDSPGHGWGYAGIPGTEEEFLSRLKDLVDTLYGLRPAAGFCYTQLTDVEQEINGLLTPDRTPKFDPEKIRRIITAV